MLSLSLSLLWGIRTYLFPLHVDGGEESYGACLVQYIEDEDVDPR